MVEQPATPSRREARCSCGALGATVHGEPVRISVCHCGQCKRRSGSAFAFNSVWPADQVETRGEFSTYTRSSDEGFWARFHFCPACGVTVFYEIERRPGLVSIPVGTFADPDFPPPTVEVYGELRCRWLPQLTDAQE
jgi:hypothetical protein